MLPKCRAFHQFISPSPTKKYSPMAEPCYIAIGKEPRTDFSVLPCLPCQSNPSLAAPILACLAAPFHALPRPSAPSQATSMPDLFDLPRSAVRAYPNCQQTFPGCQCRCRCRADAVGSCRRRFHKARISDSNRWRNVSGSPIEANSLLCQRTGQGRSLRIDSTSRQRSSQPAFDTGAGCKNRSGDCTGLGWLLFQ